MKRIKDFLYNWNDIVIIILILLAAAALISWRVDKIMDYPSTLVNDVTDNNSAGTTTEDGESTTGETTTRDDADGTNTTDASDDSQDQDGDAANTGEGDSDGAVTDGDNQGADTDADNSGDASTVDAANSTSTDQPTTTYVEPGAGPVDSSVWQNGRLRGSVTVTTAQGTAYDAVDSLVEAGLFTSFDDYYAVCMRVGVDSSLIKAATFTFDAGATQEDIVKEVTI